MNTQPVSHHITITAEDMDWIVDHNKNKDPKMEKRMDRCYQLGINARIADFKHKVEELREDKSDKGIEMYLLYKQVLRDGYNIEWE